MEHRDAQRATSLTFPSPTVSRSPSASASEPTADLDSAAVAAHFFDPPRATRTETKYRSARAPRTLDRLPRGFVWADEPHPPDDLSSPSDPAAPRAAATPGADGAAATLAKAAASARWGYVRVPENTRYVVERAGTYHRVLEPGLRIIVPGLDRVAYVFSKKMQKLAFSTAHVPTTDRVPVTVRGVLFYVVDEPIAAAYAVEDVCTALVDLAAAAVHSEFARRSVDALFRDLGHVWARVAQQVNDASHVWGVRALSFSSQVVLPPAIARAYERLTRARVQQRISDARASADARRRERRSEARAREIQVAAEGRVLVLSGDAKAESDAIVMKGDANADALSAIAEALDRPSGRDAARVWIASRYLDALSAGFRANHPSVSIDPAGPGQMVDQALNIMDTQHLRPAPASARAPASAATPTEHSAAGAPEPVPMRAPGTNSEAKGMSSASPLTTSHSRPRRPPRPQTPANVALKPPTIPEPLIIPAPYVTEGSHDTESPVTPQGPMPPFGRETSSKAPSTKEIGTGSFNQHTPRLKHLPRSRRRRSVDNLEPFIVSEEMGGARYLGNSVDGGQNGRSRELVKSAKPRILVAPVATLPRPQQSRTSTRSSSRSERSRGSGGAGTPVNATGKFEGGRIAEDEMPVIAVEFAGDAEDDNKVHDAGSGAESGADAFAAGFEPGETALWTSNVSEQDELHGNSTREGISLDISPNDVHAELASPTALAGWPRRPRRTPLYAPNRSEQLEADKGSSGMAAQPLLSPHASSMTAGEEDERDKLVAAVPAPRPRRSRHTLEFRRRRNGGGNARRSRGSIDGGVTTGEHSV